MKKFAFLLAFVAVFAMSACAFAASPAPATVIGSPASQTSGNNIGEISTSANAEANIYYIKKDAPATITFDISFDIAEAGKEDDVLSGDAPMLDDENGPAKNAIDWNTSTNKVGVSDTGLVREATGIKYEDVSLDKLPEKIVLSKIGYATPSTGKLTAGASLTLTTVDVKNALSVEMPTFYTSDDAVAKTAVAIKQPTGYCITGISDDSTPAMISWDVAPAGITVAISSDSQLCYTAEQNIKAAPGKYMGYIVTAAGGGNVVVSDDKYADIAIAGLDENDILATFTVTVEKNPAEEAAELLNGVPANKKAAVDALKAGDKAVLVVLSDDGSIASINNSNNDAVKELSGDIEALRMRVALLSVDAAGNLFPDPAYADLKFVSVVISNDSTGKDTTVSFDVTSVEGGTGPTVPVTKGVASFAVNNKSTGGAPNGFYTLFVNEGERALGGSEVSAMAAGDTLVKQGLKVNNGVNPRGSSSSCDMGFGLAAVAGLAALALRKRSK